MIPPITLPVLFVEDVRSEVAGGEAEAPRVDDSTKVDDVLPVSVGEGDELDVESGVFDGCERRSTSNVGIFLIDTERQERSRAEFIVRTVKQKSLCHTRDIPSSRRLTK